MSNQETRPTHIFIGESDYDPGYIRSISGILKIIEIILDITILICAAVWSGVGGWVVFVAISAFINTTMMLIFHCLNLFSRYTGMFFIEFITYIIMSLLFLVSAILSVVYCVQYGYPSIIATCLFTIAAMVVYTVDTYMHFIGWKETRSATYSTTQQASNL